MSLKMSLQGRGYFRRFRNFYPGAIIVSADEKRLSVMQMTKLVEWAFNRDMYLMESHDKFCTSPKAIVLIEPLELNSPNDDLGLKVLVSESS